MNPESPEELKALRARRKTEQLELYTNAQQESKVYNDATNDRPKRKIHNDGTTNNRQELAPYIDVPAQSADSAAPNEIFLYLESIKSRKLLILFAAFAGAVCGVISLIP